MESLPIIKHVALQGVGTHKFHTGFFLKLNQELIQSARLSQKAKGLPKLNKKTDMIIRNEY